MSSTPTTLPSRDDALALLHEYTTKPGLLQHALARGVEILERLGNPEWFRRAILSHADYTGVARQTPLEHVRFAYDELSGLLIACALVTPTRSLREIAAALELDGRSAIDSPS